MNVKNNNKNITWQNRKVTYEDRCKIMGQKGKVIWLTGLSGSGKSTIAIELEESLVKSGKKVYLLDGDNIRHGLNSDLGFSNKDRDENIRRVAEVTKLFFDAGFIVIVSFISPFRKMRKFAKELIDEDDFYEVYVKASLETCMKRDPKGLYKKMSNDEIKNFTGIDSVYEEPEDATLILDTESSNIFENIQQILKLF